MHVLSAVIGEMRRHKRSQLEPVPEEVMEQALESKRAIDAELERRASSSVNSSSAKPIAVQGSPYGAAFTSSLISCSAAVSMMCDLLKCDGARLTNLHHNHQIFNTCLRAMYHLPAKSPATTVTIGTMK